MITAEIKGSFDLAATFIKWGDNSCFWSTVGNVIHIKDPTSDTTFTYDPLLKAKQSTLPLIIYWTRHSNLSANISNHVFLLFWTYSVFCVSASWLDLICKPWAESFLIDFNWHYFKCTIHLIIFHFISRGTYCTLGLVFISGVLPSMDQLPLDTWQKRSFTFIISFSFYYSKLEEWTIHVDVQFVDCYKFSKKFLIIFLICLY